MNVKKRVAAFTLITLCAVAMILIALFVPCAHIVGKDSTKAVVYDKAVNLITYIKDAPFIMTDAADVYFNADGPIWLATGAILFNILIIAGAGVLLVLSLTEVLTYKAANMQIKNNCLAKKTAIFVGTLSMCISVFGITAFYVTTLLANGYVEFYSGIAQFLIVALGLAVIILAAASGKKIYNDRPIKSKNAVGFAFTAVFALLTFAVAFVPFFHEAFLGAENTIFKAAMQANNLLRDAYIAHTLGDIPFGVAQYVVFATGGAAAFVFVYSIIGFIRALAGKSTDWLSARVKRWSMALLIANTILYVMVLCQTAVLYSSVSIDGINLFLPTAYIAVFVPYLPYAFSSLIPYSGKRKAVE